LAVDGCAGADFFGGVLFASGEVGVVGPLPEVSAARAPPAIRMAFTSAMIDAEPYRSIFDFSMISSRAHHGFMTRP
jgi:hypothetical protein